MMETGVMFRETIDSDERSRGNVVMKQKRKELEGRVEFGEELLPGIPDAITLDLIAPKLLWTAFDVLSLVSRGWLQAIRSHQVYDARVRSQSGQKLVVVNKQKPWGVYDYHQAENERELALYSLGDGATYHLPRLPGGTGIYVDQCIFLDGKLYVLGGVHVTFENCLLSSDSCVELYMLDLVGQRQWRQCASLAEPRIHIGIGVLNGKIYALGRTGSGRTGTLSYLSEVYNPETNAWSPIKAWSPIPPMRFLSLWPGVVTWGEELLVHSVHRVPNGNSSVQTYNPINNRWRTVDDFLHGTEIAFMVGRQRHKLSLHSKGSRVDVYAMCENLWERVHTFSFHKFGPRGASRFWVNSCWVVGDELWLLVLWTKRRMDSKHYLLRIKGFGGQDLPWRNSTLSMSGEYFPVPFLFPIQL